MWEMAAATTFPCSSSQAPSLLSRSRSRARNPNLLLPIPLRPLVSTSKSTRCCSSSSYNGWADLAADPDLPFSLPPSQALLLLPVAALSLSRLPPLPLLAAAFAAGFAVRHLAPAPSPHRLLLADLDAHLRAFKDQLASGATDAGLLLQAVDRARDALASLAAQGNTTAFDGALTDAAKEVADYFGGWARQTLRDLSFTSPPRHKTKPAAAVLDARTTNNLDHKDDHAAAAQAQQQQQRDGDKLLDSSIHATAQDMQFNAALIGTATARPLDMLPFDKDANGLEDAGLDATKSTQEDGRLERLLSKHRYGRRGVRNDHLQGGRFVTESTESSLLERTLEIRDRSYRLKIERRDGESQASEAQERPTDRFVGNSASVDDPIVDDESAATGSDGKEFNRNVKDAAEILRKARECMMARSDEETADALLYKSARLLSTAVALRPTSLVAVGQLGNTYLLHGELKLKISRELRALLDNSGAYLNGRERFSRAKKLDTRILSREHISSALAGVCEECESLLVEAGRSYRMAVSIDSGDVKALYNWGLALIFRAQLLADIGPEAAVDADRVYLAAIDKFDAMLSKSNTYAPEALYRWGSALQQRSHLRSRNNKDKIRLLEQAKSMYEDVLYVEAGSKMHAYIKERHLRPAISLQGKPDTHHNLIRTRGCICT